MELFKNSVGRPSNEILQKRKKFILLIAVAVIAVLGAGTLLMVKSFNGGIIDGSSKNAKTNYKKKFTATFKMTGPDGTIYNKTVPCETKNSPTDSSCLIYAPSMTKAGFKAIGWTQNKNKSGYSVSPGQRLGLSSNVIYYAITMSTKPYTVTYKKTSNVSSIGDSSDKCYRYNGASSCSIKETPSIKPKKGYVVVGWSTNKNAKTADIRVGKSITLSSNRTYYAIVKKK